VANPLEFCQSLSALTVPNGATVISTINRSMRAYAAAIVGAEYILRWVSLIVHLAFFLFQFLRKIDSHSWQSTVASLAKS
uniref:Coenzyme Q3, methyltransferase n=1 Tax=Aegilops tauschii subsp. strangulata TaxID=200361 RepID=A0A453QQB1_AEGTS